MLNYKFNQGLITTAVLLKLLPIPDGTLDYWKWKWKKDGHNTYDMGLRLIGKRAFWDPIVFCNWVAQNKLKNKPTTPEQILDEEKLIMFVKKNVKLNGRARI
tara:strand:- start:418 stop:723 length:306 start_codon:yes stop_codon:yes gene_type:complete